MQEPLDWLDGESRREFYGLLRLVAARYYRLTAGEAARLTDDQLDEVALTIVSDPSLGWRIDWAAQDAAVAEAERILGLEGGENAA